MSVYFLQAVTGGPIKIGLAGSVEERVKAIQSCSPSRLRILAKANGDGRAETWLHRHFKDSRLHGEWFRPSSRLMLLIESVRAGHCLPRIPIRVPKKRSQECPAARVIAKCGGIEATATLVGRHRSVVNRWLRPKEAGGTGGLVPATHQQTLMRAARKQGFDLVAEDFFDVPKDDKAQDAPSHAAE